jgi:hypothetical protein
MLVTIVLVAEHEGSKIRATHPFRFGTLFAAQPLERGECKPHERRHQPPRARRSQKMGSAAAF